MSAKESCLRIARTAATQKYTCTGHRILRFGEEKTMISEQRLAANRQNAARSTGPRTEAGKELSRRNSLKLGLTGAGVVLADDDAAEVEAKRELFSATIDTANEVEAVLVERMALASVRMNRCV